jgi:hypothetical protein
MQCKDIEEVLEQEGLSPLSASAQAHLASCDSCRHLVEDFSAILAVAEKLPTEVEPPARVWVSLRNQLEAEGFIKTPAEAPSSAELSWWDSLTRILGGRAVATAVVGLVIVVAAFVQIGRDTGPVRIDESVPGPKIAEQAPPSPIIPNEPLGETGQTLRQEEQKLPMVENAGLSNQDGVDTSLRQNLVSLNQFIEDCRRRLKEDPNDELAREYLSVAYQQKAELLSAMLDRGRSVN